MQLYQIANATFVWLCLYKEAHYIVACTKGFFRERNRNQAQIPFKIGLSFPSLERNFNKNLLRSMLFRGVKGCRCLVEALLNSSVL